MASLQLSFLDVQHGSACHIETPDGKHIMFDLGTGDFDNSQGKGGVHSPLMYLYNKGIRSLDSVIITHPHADHIADIENFSILSPRSLFRPRHLTEDFIRGENQGKDQSKVDKYLKISQEYSTPFAPGESPLLAANNGCDLFEVFTPLPDSTNLNDHSIALVIGHSGTKILLTGDTEQKGWKSLLGNPLFVNAARGTDVLLASHHGRDNGYYEELFSVIGDPYITIVSDGQVGTTSVTEKYRAKMKGWEVSNRKNGEREKRFCLTTRADGTIQITCYRNEDGNFMSVSTAR